jgi:integrase
MSVTDSTVPARRRATDRKGRPVKNIYVRSDGRYVGAFTGSDKKRRMVVLRDESGRYAETLKEALVMHRAQLTKVDNGTDAAPCDLTFNDVADQFLAMFAGKVKTGERSERTLDSYRECLRHRINPVLGTKKIHKVTVNDLGKMIADWTGEGLSAQTIRTTLIPCGRILKFAVRRGYISDNPMSKLERDEKPRIQKHEPRILGHDEIKALINNAPKQYEACITTAVFSGLRAMELLGLRWQDVDFDAGLIRVRFQLSRAKKATATESARPPRLVPLKTGAGRRDVILMPQLAARLKRHREEAFAHGTAKAEDSSSLPRSAPPPATSTFVSAGWVRRLTVPGSTERDARSSGCTISGIRSLRI